MMADLPLGSVRFLLLLLVCCGHSLANVSAESPDEPSEPADKLSVQYLAQSRGFSIETHQAITGDGYLLSLHRLVNPLVGRHELRGAVLIQHGILSASAFFLMNSSAQLDRPQSLLAASNRNTTSNSLAIALANRGYDVWLANLRGTQHSRGHLAGSLLGPAYWDFNVDTLIEQDLDACVRLLLRETGRTRYTFVGHSLGATIGIGGLLAHRNTDLAERLACAVLMAPVASTQFMNSSLIPLFRLAALLYEERAPFPGTASTFAAFTRRVCLFARRLCVSLASRLLGQRSALSAGAPDEADELQNQVGAFVLMMRQAVSVQVLKHIVQVHAAGRLSKYSYGPAGNLLVYGSETAPVYDLHLVERPSLRVALVSGPSDAISTPGEVDWIAGQLAGRVRLLRQISVAADPFNHLDLVLSSRAGELVNRQVVGFIEQNHCL